MEIKEKTRTFTTTKKCLVSVRKEANQTIMGYRLLLRLFGGTKATQVNP